MNVRNVLSVAEGLCLSGCVGCCTWFPRFSVNLLLIWGIITHLIVSHQLGYWGLLPGYIGVFCGICSLVAYFNICRVGAGSPLDVPELIGDEETGIPAVLLNSVQTKYDGGHRYCNKCLCWKPDRVHHCRKCGTCILKMDHHCPWFATCIGFKNHKYFVQFLWYVAILCVVAALQSIPLVYIFFHEQRYNETTLGINFVLYFLLGAVMGLTVTGFAAYTTWIMALNATTLERMEEKAYRVSLSPREFRYRAPPNSSSVGNVFDLGPKENISQVMGSTWKQWLLPIPPTMPDNVDPRGISFPVNRARLERAEEMARTEISLRDRRRAWETNGNDPPPNYT